MSSYQLTKIFGRDAEGNEYTSEIKRNKINLILKTMKIQHSKAVNIYIIYLVVF